MIIDCSGIFMLRLSALYTQKGRLIKAEPSGTAGYLKPFAVKALFLSLVVVYKAAAKKYLALVIGELAEGEGGFLDSIGLQDHCRKL